jgi:hypothetical protein
MLAMAVPVAPLAVLLLLIGGVVYVVLARGGGDGE